MIMQPLERLEGNSAECHDYFRINQFNRAFQKNRAVAQFLRCRPAVCAGRAARITQRRAGDENFRSLQTRGREKTLEVLSRLIAREWNPRLVRAFSSGRFADKHNARVNRTIEFAEDGGASAHRRTASTVRRFSGQSCELLFLVHHMKTVDNRSRFA